VPDILARIVSVKQAALPALRARGAALEQLAALSNIVPAPRTAQALEQFVAPLHAAGSGAVSYDYAAAGTRTPVVGSGQPTVRSIH